MSRRVVAWAGLGAAVVAVALVLLRGGGDPQRLTVVLQNASQLVKGDEVKVGGLPVGSVDDIVLSRDGLAEVRISVTDEDLTPLHRGTRAEVRQSSLSSVANRFIQLHPGPNSSPALDDGGRIPLEATDSVVEVDSVLSTLDADTRRAAQELLDGSNRLYAGRTAEANRAGC